MWLVVAGEQMPKTDAEEAAKLLASEIERYFTHTHTHIQTHTHTHKTHNTHTHTHTQKHANAPDSHLFMHIHRTHAPLCSCKVSAHFLMPGSIDESAVPWWLFAADVFLSVSGEFVCSCPH